MPAKKKLLAAILKIPSDGSFTPILRLFSLTSFQSCPHWLLLPETTAFTSNKFALVWTVLAGHWRLFLVFGSGLLCWTVKEYLDCPDHTIVALYKKLVVGCGFLTPGLSCKCKQAEGDTLAGYTSGYITYLFVHPEWQRAGVGTFMLYHLIQVITLVQFSVTTVHRPFPEKTLHCTSPPLTQLWSSTRNSGMCFVSRCHRWYIQ